MIEAKFQAWRDLHHAEAQLDVLLEAFGDHLAEKEGYQTIGGIEAVHLYLIRKYSWLPRDVLTMRTSELRLALHVELQGWKAPPGVV